MPLKKLLFRPGLNRESTRYAAETISTSSLPGAQTVGGWYSADKVRFRSGSPEKIGGWKRISNATFLGVCRSIWNWVTLEGYNLLGMGTHLKFYIERGGAYNDITPIRATASLTDPFTATTGSSILLVTDVAHGAVSGSFVTFSGATGLGGNLTAAVLNREYQIVVLGDDTYQIDTGVVATVADTGNGGAVTAAYQLNVGYETQTPLVGWGAGPWGYGRWGLNTRATIPLRLWSISNFGEDLVFGPRSGGIYYWDASAGVGVRGVDIATLPGASDTPTVQNYLLVSDSSRFVLALGCNDLGSATQDPMLIRWSDQESLVNWTPAATNQAGSIRLSQGSELITALQTRQEILVWSDSALYSLQYVGSPAVWQTQLMGSNISIASQNAASVAANTVFWMGVDKFYKYDGRVQAMRCDLRQHVFGNINQNQLQQVFSGTNEGFNEVWWFYCSGSSTVVDSYVVYNYLEDTWTYGTLSRSAWIDSGLREYPQAACYSGVVVNHEQGVDDQEGEEALPIAAYITSTEFDIDDGHSFGFVYRILPDITFRGSAVPDGGTPTATITLTPLKNSGSGYTNPASVAGSSNATIQRIASAPVEEFTGQVYIRVRGRQMTLKVESNQIGCTWQLGAPRIDLRADGRRG